MKPRIYDCFCYFNEDMILELRMETLWDHVDYFVIAEAVYTQVGQPKPLNFKIERFAKYREKIRYLVVDHFPPGAPSFWKNENYQRNFLMNGLYDARPEDWILVSDLDEIPRPDKIALFDPQRYIRGDFQQRAYAYFLNNLSVEDGRPAYWYGSKVTTYARLTKFFGTVTAVRSYKSSGLLRSLKRSFFRRFQVQNISDGGWHFTWVMKPEKIRLKMESIAEQEFVHEENKDLRFIEAQIRSGRCVVNPKSRFLAQSVDEAQFPAYLVAHQVDLYAEWLLPASPAVA